MTEERTFPVMVSQLELRYRRGELEGVEELRRSVPWGLVEASRAQLERNHGRQTLERLKERGGLSPAELVCGLEGVGLFGPRFHELVDDLVALAELEAHLRRYRAARRRARCPVPTPAETGCTCFHCRRARGEAPQVLPGGEE